MKRVAATAAALGALAWAPAAVADTPPACAAPNTVGVTLSSSERGEPAGLVATHDVLVEAEFTGTTASESLTLPPGVTVLAEDPTQVAFIVPAAASVPITVSWHQATDPSGDPTDPALNCSASRVISLPIKAARPSHAAKLRAWKFAWRQGAADFAVVPALKQPDLSPLEISIRTSARARLPKAKAKARTMVVPMRTVDQVEYPKPLPSLFHISVARECRFFFLTCGAVFSEVARPFLDDGALQHGVEKADINGGAKLLARTQPALEAARYGVVLEARPGGVRVGKPRPFGYDMQVHQSGRLIARVRAAGRCAELKRPQGLVLDCRIAKHSAKLH